MEPELTIQQVAAETGLSEHTLRYYERIGLIGPVERAANGHRRYTADDLGWVDLLIRLRTTGMPIAKMKQYADFQRQGDETFARRLALLESHQRRVLERLEELQKNLSIINYKIDYYSKLNKECEEAAGEALPTA